MGLEMHNMTNLIFVYLYYHYLLYWYVYLPPPPPPKKKKKGKRYMKYRYISYHEPKTWIQVKIIIVFYQIHNKVYVYCTYGNPIIKTLVQAVHGRVYEGMNFKLAKDNYSYQIGINKMDASELMTDSVLYVWNVWFVTTLAALKWLISQQKK